MRFLPIFLIFSLSEMIVAETSEQYVVRSEFMFCKYNEGKGYNDVVEQSKQYQKFLEEKGLKYTRYVMTPIWAGKQEYDYILSGNWPDGQEQYREWGAYLNEYPQWLAEQDIDVSQAGTCSASVSMRNHAVMRIRINQDDYDRINFVALRNCNFTETASMSELSCSSCSGISSLSNFLSLISLPSSTTCIGFFLPEESCTICIGFSPKLLD